MSDDRQSPPRKRARLSSPTPSVLASPPTRSPQRTVADALITIAAVSHDAATASSSSPPPPVVTPPVPQLRLGGADSNVMNDVHAVPGVTERSSRVLPSLLARSEQLEGGHAMGHQEPPPITHAPRGLQRLPSLFSSTTRPFGPYMVPHQLSDDASVDYHRVWRSRRTGVPIDARPHSDTVVAATTAALVSAPPAATDHEVDMASADIENATMMLLSATPTGTAGTPPPPAGEESSGTDDEELQQLSMATQDACVELDLLNGEGGGEVKFEDLLATVFVAAKEAKMATVQQCFRIVKKSANADELMKRTVDAEDETGLTLLMISVRNNLLPLTAFLLQEGADLNHSNEKRTYALLLAAQKGLTEMTRFLVDHGANDESKNMSLIPAAHFGHLAVVQLLLESGGDQNYSNRKGTTPLMRAAQEGRDEVVRFLLAKGADACAANNEGMTALMLAAQRGHAKIATILIKSGSDVNKQTRQGSTALLLAAKRGHTAAVESLLTAGADIFLKDDRDKTAAETANRRGHLDLFLKITVSNQLRLMREDLRRERSFTLMRLSTLYVLSRADLAAPFHRAGRRKDFELMDRTMRLPKPLLENIALYLPLCRLWDRQLRYLVHEAPLQPNRVVTQGIKILDEVLLTVSLEMRASLRSIKQPHDARAQLPVCGHLALLRDSDAYRALFTTESAAPMSFEMLAQFRRMADIQGALETYSGTGAIQFGGEVAQDVVALLTNVLYWNDERKRAENSSIVALDAAADSKGFKDAADDDEHYKAAASANAPVAMKLEEDCVGALATTS